MRYLGKGSVASFLGVILNIVWYALFVMIGLTLVGALTVGSIAPKLIPSDLDSMKCGTGFISFTFQQAQAHHPQAILLGILAVILVLFIVAQTVVYQLRKIFGALRSGKVFTQENAKRIRTIGLITIGGSVVQCIINSILGWIIVNNVTIPGVEIQADSGLSLGIIFIGLVILVLGEIFRQGAALQEDQNLTI